MSESKLLWELGIHKGKWDEHERIIALLKELRAVGYEQEVKHDALIALIKGENE